MKKIYWQVQQINRIGGAEMVSIDLANHLSKDYDITLISTVKIEGDIPYHIEPTVTVTSWGIPKRIERVDVLTSKYLKHWRIFSLLALYCQVLYHYVLKRPIYMRRMQKKLLEDDAILICSAIDGYMLAPRKGRVFFHFHFDAPTFFRFDNRFVFKHYRKPDKFIFLTKVALDGVLEKMPELKDKAVYVHNPFRFFRVLNTNYHNNTIIFAGRFNTQKNPMLALRIAKELKDRNFPFVLRMFGDPIMKKEMDLYIEENHLEDVIELHGPSNYIHDEMLNSDILLLTSIYEGLPLVLAEANALSLPWVSSYWGPVIDEAFVDGKSGIVIRDGEVNSYANAIIGLLSDKEKLIEAKKNAFEQSINLSHEVIIPLWKEILK